MIRNLHSVRRVIETLVFYLNRINYTVLYCVQWLVRLFYALLLNRPCSEQVLHLCCKSNDLLQGIHSDFLLFPPTNFVSHSCPLVSEEFMSFAAMISCLNEQTKTHSLYHSAAPFNVHQHIISFPVCITKVASHSLFNYRCL